VRRPLLTLLSVTAVVALPGCAFGVAERARFLASTSATVDGSLHSQLTGPGGVGVRYFYEYGETTGYGTRFGFGSVAINQPGAGYGIATKLTGLEPGTTYHYRLCASDQENAGNPMCSADVTFTTPTTTGPYLTLVPLCNAPTGLAEGVDITGTGFPVSPPTGPLYIGSELSRDGGPFQPSGSGLANSDGELNVGGTWDDRGEVHVWDVRTFLDPNFNASQDPGEQLLATGHYEEHC
jgi:hypothetical protein